MERWTEQRMNKLLGYHQSGTVFALALSLAVCVTFGHPALAQTAAGKAGQRGSTKDAPLAERFVQMYFANHLREGENLAAACKRSNFSSLINLLLEIEPIINARPGEFESPVALEQQEKQFQEFLETNSRLFFCIPLKTSGVSPTFSMYYKFDKTKFWFSFGKQTVLNEYEQKNKAFQAKTILGQSFTVFPFTKHRWDVEIENGFNKECIREPSDYVAEFYYPSEKAQNLKETGFLIIEGKIVRPYARTWFNYGEAFINNPRQNNLSVYYSYFEGRRSVVVDQLGEVVWECSKV